MDMSVLESIEHFQQWSEQQLAMAVPTAAAAVAVPPAAAAVAVPTEAAAVAVPTAQQAP